MPDQEPLYRQGSLLTSIQYPRLPGLKAKPTRLPHLRPAERDNGGQAVSKIQYHKGLK
jgi:hypothetical protein